MKLRFLSVLLTLLMPVMAFAQTDGQHGAPSEIRVMSFNVRNSGAKDGLNDWQHRKELFFSTIEQFNPDLLGTQEVLANQYDAIVERMKGYTPVGPR